MREKRLRGSEGGLAKAIPTPIVDGTDKSASAGTQVSGPARVRSRPNGKTIQALRCLGGRLRGHDGGRSLGAQHWSQTELHQLLSRRRDACKLRPRG